MACDFRIAAESASFGQPEINLGLIPGFGGTQRLPRLVGQAKALEMNLIGDEITGPEAAAYGLATRVVPDHELFDTALSWARKLAGQAPIAVREIKDKSAKGDLDEGIAGGEGGLRDRVLQRRRQGGHQRLPGQANAAVEGRVSGGSVERDAPDRAVELAELIRESRHTVALTGAGISVPSGIPDFRSPGTGIWENVNPFEVASIDAFHRDTERFWEFYRPRFEMLGDKRPNPAHEALAELEDRGLLSTVITQNIDRLHRAAGTRDLIEVHGSIATSSCTSCSATWSLEQVEELFDLEDGVATCSACIGKVKPDVVLFGEMLPVEAIERARALAASADLMLCIGSSLEVFPAAGLPELTLATGGRIAVVTQGPTPYDREAAVKLEGDVAEELPAVVAAL